MQIKFSILQIPALHLQPRHQFQSGDGQKLLLSLLIPEDGHQKEIGPDRSSKLYTQDHKI